MTDNPMTEGGALVRVKLMTGEFMMSHPLSHPTDGMDKIMMVEIFKTVLVRVVGVGMTIEVVCQRILDTILIVSILPRGKNTWDNSGRRTYSVSGHDIFNFYFD